MKERAANAGIETVETTLPTPKNAAASLHLKRLLVPIDFSDCSFRALDYALDLADEFGARVILLHVIDPAFPHGSFLPGAGDGEEASQALLVRGRERLANLGRKRIGNRLPYETLARMGRAQSEIPDTAKALAADLIVLGTYGLSGVKQVALGSTAERVVRHSHCPVLTVPLSGNGHSLSKV